jgi:hypothetical protein
MKYGKFVTAPMGLGRHAIIIENADKQLYLHPGGINIYGKVVKVVKTAGKAWRIILRYEQRMGRI